MADVQTIAPVEYRLIEGYPGYRVGSDGTVWSCKNGRRGYLETWRPLNLNVMIRGGYREVTLSRSQPAQTRRIKVHRLVLEVFVGAAPAGFDGCHNNGDRADNSLSNLRWDTRRSNCDDTRKHGRVLLGEKTNSAKLTADDVRAIRALREQGHSLNSIGRRFGVGGVTVLRIARRDTWAHVT